MSVSRELFRSPSVNHIAPPTPYTEGIKPYKNSSSNKNIKNAISTLVDYVAFKHSLNTEKRTVYLKEAVEEIENEIKEVQRMNGGKRRRRTHKKAVRRNKTHSRK
jgi:hypothetical protein